MPGARGRHFKLHQNKLISAVMFIDSAGYTVWQNTLVSIICMFEQHTFKPLNRVKISFQITKPGFKVIS